MLTDKIPPTEGWETGVTTPNIAALPKQIRKPPPSINTESQMQVQAATLVAEIQQASSRFTPPSLEFLSPEPVRGGCGYFDSSFELNQGLLVTEESDPILLQLWTRTTHCASTVH